MIATEQDLVALLELSTSIDTRLFRAFQCAMCNTLITLPRVSKISKRPEHMCDACESRFPGAAARVRAGGFARVAPPAPSAPRLSKKFVVRAAH